MSLQDELVADCADIFADANGPAEDATFLPANSQQGKPCRVIVDRGDLGLNVASDGQSQIAAATLSVGRAAVPIVHINDRFIVEARSTAQREIWAVNRLIAENAGLHEVSIVLIQRTKLAGAEDERQRQ